MQMRAPGSLRDSDASLLLRDRQKALPCGCTLRWTCGEGDLAVVEFRFCDAHRKVKVVKVDPQWPKVAAAAVAAVARRFAEFTPDDVWEEIAGDGVQGGDPRGLGPIMMAAAREGIIEATDEHRSTRRRESHGRPVRVWRSLVVRGAGRK